MRSRVRVLLVVTSRTVTDVDYRLLYRELPSLSNIPLKGLTQ